MSVTLKLSLLFLHLIGSVIITQGSYLPPEHGYSPNNIPPNFNQHQPAPAQPPSRVVNVQQFTQGTQTHIQEIHPQKHSEPQLEILESPPPRSRTPGSSREIPNQHEEPDVEHRYPDKTDYQVEALQEILNHGNQAIDEQERRHKTDKEIVHTIVHENAVFLVSPHMEEEVNKTEEFVMRPRNGHDESKEKEESPENHVFVHVQLEQGQEPEGTDSEPNPQFHSQSQDSGELWKSHLQQRPQHQPGFHPESEEMPQQFQHQPRYHPLSEESPRQFQYHPGVYPESEEIPQHQQVQHPDPPPQQPQPQIYQQQPQNQPPPPQQPNYPPPAQQPQIYQQQQQPQPQPPLPSIVQIQGPMGPGQPPFQGQIISQPLPIPQMPQLQIPQFLPIQPPPLPQIAFPGSGQQPQGQGSFPQFPSGFPMNHP